MNHQDQQGDGRSGSGIGRDLRSVRDNGKASLQELREFVGNLKGRGAREVVGIVSGNSLIKGVEMAALGFVVVLLIFTAIPFYMAGDESVAKKSPAASAKTTPAPEKSNQSETGKQGQAEATDSGTEAVDNLGIGETKTFDTDENPLEKKLDNLLDGVK